MDLPTCFVRKVAAGSYETGGRDAGDVERLLKGLSLSEAEKDGVVLAAEERTKLPKVKWMAMARLLTTKKFSEQSLISTMIVAWNTTKEVSFRSIETNLFQVQAFCHGDWKRIMEEGPWIFRGYALMMEEFDGSTPTPTKIPWRVQAWVKIHKIPPLYKSQEIIERLAASVGEVISVEMKVVSSGRGDFFRARVNLDAAKPLVRFVSLSPEGSGLMLLQVKYEKMPCFCFHYGQMGHTHLECGSGEFKEED
jgi:hypothetical protein